MVEEDAEPLELNEADGLGDVAPKRMLTTRAIVAIAAAVVIVAGGAFWALSWFSTADDRDIASQRQALSESWKQAQADEAQGVDFDLELNSSELGGSSLSFDHTGMVSAKDECFEATSEYIVREDGSLAIQDLTGAWQNTENSQCANRDFSSIFLASKVSFNMETSDSWTAYDARGNALVSDLKEKPVEIELQIQDMGASEDNQRSFG